MDISKGVNVFGFINGEFGLGASCRSLIKKLEEDKIPFSLIELETYLEKGNYYECQEDNPFLINLIFCNPNRNPFAEKGLAMFSSKLNVAIWFWELEDVPPLFKEFSIFYDEIWVNSKFCLEVFGKLGIRANFYYFLIEIEISILCWFIL
jgi:hypothetical protein